MDSELKGLLLSKRIAPENSIMTENFTLNNVSETFNNFGEQSNIFQNLTYHSKA